MQRLLVKNSNNSVKVPTEFLTAIEEDGDRDLIARTDGSVMKIRKLEISGTKSLMRMRCADPGVQYDTTINECTLSPMGGRIRASNPCSEYLF